MRLFENKDLEKIDFKSSLELIDLAIKRAGFTSYAIENLVKQLKLVANEEAPILSLDSVIGFYGWDPETREWNVRDSIVSIARHLRRNYRIKTRSISPYIKRVVSLSIANKPIHERMNEINYYNAVYQDMVIPNLIIN